MKKFTMILMSLLLLVISSFFYINHLHNKIYAANITDFELSFLDGLNLISENKTRSRLKASNHIQSWLILTQFYAKKNIELIYELANYYLNENNLSVAKHHFRKAIAQGHYLSHIKLATHYINNNLYDNAITLLEPVSDQVEALSLLYHIAIIQGNQQFITQNQAKLKQIDNTGFYQELVKYSVFESITAEEDNIVNETCSITVTMFATTLSGLRKVEQLHFAYQQQPLAKTICLTKAKYIPANVLNCSPYKQSKITCDASVWQNYLTIKSRYIGVMVEQGGANVDNGIMYLDQADDVDVLTHELSHFLGFVDEYPLNQSHHLCAKAQAEPFSHNLVVIKSFYLGERQKIRSEILAQTPWRQFINDSTPILTKYQHGWRVGTPKTFQDKYGMFAAKTCDNSENFAFKPYAKRTKLEYYELDFPQQYYDILQQARWQFLMPSFHYNVSRDLAKKGEIEKAKKILKLTRF